MTDFDWLKELAEKQREDEKKLHCYQCKNYRDVDHGFGEPEGRCALGTALQHLKKALGKEVDLWSNTTGSHAICDYLDLADR